MNASDTPINSAEVTGKPLAQPIMPPAHWDDVHRQSQRLRQVCYTLWKFPFLAELSPHLRPFSETPGSSVLEVGCAPGRFLIYFHQVFGWEVAGLELSLPGVERTQQQLAANNISAPLYQGDIFELTPDRQFDVVVSFGLVEHFDDPIPCYRAMAQWLRPGGALLTTVPNLEGLLGKVMKARNIEDYRGHQRYTHQMLADHCRQVGLDPVFAGRVGSFLVPHPFGRIGARPWQRLANFPPFLANALINRLTRVLKRPIPLGSLTPYAACVAFKPGQHQSASSDR